MVVSTTNSTATQGDGKPKIGKQDQSSTTNQDFGQGFNKSNSTVHSMGLSNPDMVAKSQVHDHANLSKKLFEAISISFKTQCTGKTVTFANTVRLWNVDDLHHFREVLWRCVLALFNIESMMTSRAKTPQAELQQAQAIREYTENINRILGEVERARDVETDASAAMNKAKSK